MMEKVSVGTYQIGNYTVIADRILQEAAINSELYISHAMEGVSVGIKTWLLKGPHPAKTVTLSAPADWWEHFKERWFPDWLKERYPVRYGYLTEHEVGPIYLCPHSDVKWKDNAREHLFWIVRESHD